MARVRLSAPAQADLANILAASAERWGSDGMRRYAALLARAIRIAAAAPHGPTTRDRGDLLRGTRSLHLRHARASARHDRIRAPVHVLYYRVTAAAIEIIRVLHERMDPGSQLMEQRTQGRRRS